MEDKPTDKTKSQERLYQKLKKMRATDNTQKVYDNTFKTMSVRIPRFNIPLINEMFGTNYSLRDEVELLYTEETGIYNSFQIRERNMDANIRIQRELTRRYHLECESNVNGEIAIRLFEYDWLDAIGHIHGNNGEYIIKLQNSGLLYLRSNENTPKQFTYRLILPGGVEAAYQVPIIKNPDYTLEQIFEKQLYMLLPYYFIKYEKVFSGKSVNLEQIEETEKAEKNVADMLEKDLDTLYNELNKLVQKGIINDYERGILYQLIWNVSNQIFRNQQTIKERMANFMGGEVLEFDWDIEYRKQMKEAKEEGRGEGQDLKLISLICRKLKRGKTPDVIAEELEEELGVIEKICDTAENFAPEYDVEKIYEALHFSVKY